MALCSNCRQSIPGDATFCGYCGGPLAATDDDSIAAEESGGSEPTADWTPPDEEALHQITMAVAKLLAEGEGKEEIVRKLVRLNGWPEASAIGFVGRVEQEMTQFVAEALAEGASKDALVQKLVRNDWPEQLASQFVTNMEQALNEYKKSPEAREIAAGNYARHMLFGALWAGGGAVVTLGTLSAAGPGETYYIAWGAMGFGALEFLWGLFGRLVYR